MDLLTAEWEITPTVCSPHTQILREDIFTREKWRVLEFFLYLPFQWFELKRIVEWPHTKVICDQERNCPYVTYAAGSPIFDYIG